MAKSLIILPFLTLALALAAGPANAGGLRSAKADAVRALKRASKDVKSRASCQQTQGGNIADALKRTKRINANTSPGEPEDLRLFLAGLSLGAAFSGCPDALYGNISKAQDALSQVAVALNRRAPTPRYDDDDDDEDSEDEDSEARRPRKGVVADVSVDPDFVTKRREPALLVLAEDVEAFGLRGKTVVWKLLVKKARKRSWKRARKYKIGKSKVRKRSQELGDVSISVRYSTMEDDGLNPGKHIAALIGTVRGREVFRDEMKFRIPELDDDEDFEVERRVAVRASRDRRAQQPVDKGPRAMGTKAFNGFASTIKNTRSDLSRVDMIESAARKNHFTSRQLGVLLDASRSDLTKMDMAKAVVPKLVDPQNAYGLAEKFRSSLSREEFTELL